MNVIEYNSERSGWHTGFIQNLKVKTFRISPLSIIIFVDICSQVKEVLLYFQFTESSDYEWELNLNWFFFTFSEMIIWIAWWTSLLTLRKQAIYFSLRHTIFASFEVAKLIC